MKHVMILLLVACSSTESNPPIEGDVSKPELSFDGPFEHAEPSELRPVVDSTSYSCSDSIWQFDLTVIGQPSSLEVVVASGESEQFEPVSPAAGQVWTHFSGTVNASCEQDSLRFVAKNSRGQSDCLVHGEQAEEGCRLERQLKH